MSDNDTTQTQDGAAAPKWSASKILIAVIITALVTFGMTALLMNILERRSEQAQPAHNVVELTRDTHDPAVWGQNYPRQYESYKATSEMVATT